MYSKNTSYNCSLLFWLGFLRCTRSHNCICKTHNATISECSLQTFYIWMETHLDVRNNSESQRNESVQRKWKEWMKKRNIGNREVQHPRKCWSSACASDLCQHYRRCQGNQEHTHKAIMGLLLQRKTQTNATRKTVRSPHILLFMQTDIFYSSWIPLLFLISLIRNGTLPSKAVQWLPHAVWQIANTAC